MHLGDSAKFMVGPHVTVNPLICIAMVTLLISLRDYFSGLPEFISDEPSVILLCVLLSECFPSVLDSLLPVASLMGSFLLPLVQLVGF